MKAFRQIINKLRSKYGPAPTRTSDPLELILWENIGYLVDDEKRALAFERLRKEVGLRPENILSASPEKLVDICRIGGIHPELRAQRLKEIAHIVLNDFDGDVGNALKLPLPKAIKALKKFPSIGDPGAEKILLFTKTYPVLALESNGLRVLLRLGFGQEQKNYSASYRSVREALAEQTGSDCDFLVKAHELLRQHGREICKTNHPKCNLCPLNKTCQGAFLK
ncbi:MAG TPA: hypothetical protein VN643_25395 [Pyrinomonadaceae bacterium]|nr:hypothetical protein [Pyrinomonadaceae bacterium]